MKSFSLDAITRIFMLVGCLLLLPATAVLASHAENAPEIPIPGMVTVVELGSVSCVPCKLMLPIIEELKKEYEGRIAIISIDVLEHPGAGQKYGIMAIPTQIFFDANGKEALRHVGFMEKAAIVAELEKLGVK